MQPRTVDFAANILIREQGEEREQTNMKVGSGPMLDLRITEETKYHLSPENGSWIIDL